MTPLTILRFLFGSRDAIERIAACRQAPWIGLLLVFSAALAREYDGQDLLHEPWHLFLPLIASLATSFVLYLLLRVVGWFRAAGWKPFWSGYWSFLGLYWMTAPLAWLYAIPVERFLDAGDATRANLCLLGIVSLWRVLLVTQSVSTLWSVPFWAALLPVMLFADTVAVVLIIGAPRPILGVMGGIRLSEAEHVIYDASCVAIFYGIVSWPLWFLGTAWVGLFRRSPEYVYPSRKGDVLTRGSMVHDGEWRIRKLDMVVTVSGSTWLSGGAALLILSCLAYSAQSPQLLRRAIERDFRAGRIDAALRLMSVHDRSDFPPHWDPPPRLGFRETRPRIVDVIKRLNEVESAPWVRHLYVRKFANHLRGEDDYTKIWHSLDARELDEHLAVLAQLPERSLIIHEHRESLGWMLEDKRTPEDVRQRLRELLGENTGGSPRQRITPTPLPP